MANGYGRSTGGFSGMSRDQVVELIVKTSLENGIRNPKQIAYMLATAQHESRNFDAPEEDFGRQQARKIGYGGGENYYGRGLVHLTHDRNYKKMGERLNLPLLQNPELAVQPDIAAKIMVIGMKEGMFTGARLNRYINDEKTDYINARRTVNGDTHKNGALIAGYARQWEKSVPQLIDKVEQKRQNHSNNPSTSNPTLPTTAPKPDKQSAQSQNELLLLQTALQSGISSRTELANLMAQCAHESMGFNRMDEGFKYSKSIDYIKEKHKSTERFSDNELETARQEALSGNPQKLAEMMYGSRPDLGNIHPGDGFKFHGRGFVQLLGRNDYEAAGKALNLDLVNNPDLAAKPEHAAKIAVWYWQHNIVSKGIQENVRETGIAFNGATTGLDSRQKSFENLFQKLTPEYVAKVAAHTPQRTELERQTKPNAAAPALDKPASLGTTLNAINNKLDTLLKAHESGNQNAFRQQVCEMAQHRDAGQMMARASAEAQHERAEQQQNAQQREALQQENAQQQGKAMRR